MVLTVKQEEHGTVSDLLDKFHNQLLSNYRWHSYNIGNQYKHYLWNMLQPTECFIHVEFSENCVCKMHTAQKTLTTVPGTLQIHQVVISSPEHTKYRDVSCTCSETSRPDHTLHDISLVVSERDASRKRRKPGSTW